MTENIYTALSVFLVGMITVFVVLSLVVLTGKVLIALTNKYFPPEIKKIPPSLVPAPVSTSTIAPAKLAAIVAAVEIATQGKGRITTINNQVIK